MTTTQRITFLDNDHVMNLARSFASWTSNDDKNYVREFFLPEVVDDLLLASIGGRLEAVRPVEIHQADDGAVIRGSSAVVFRRGSITASMMDSCPDLKLIQRLGESSTGIDVAAALERNVQVSCLPRHSLVHVAEHVMLLMLALARRMLPSVSALQRYTGPPGQIGNVAYNWTNMSGMATLAGQTLGVIGLGEVGLLVAQRAIAFGMRVVYAKRVRLPENIEQQLSLEHADLDDVLARADYVSLHVPGGPASRHLIGERQLKIMKPGAYLINTARGSVVDEFALLKALERGQIAGAALDVHAAEPRQARDALASLHNTIVTPHIAAGSRTVLLPEVADILENVADALSGRMIQHAPINRVTLGALTQV